MKRLFGTDGIRGVAGQFPLTPADVARLGVAAGNVLKKRGRSKTNQVLVVRDTRGSGNWIFKNLAQGLASTGVHVLDAGVLSTPSAAYLVRSHKFQSGVVISASHNPPEFNGIKFFTSQGTKWPDAWEHAVEEIFHRKPALPRNTGDDAISHVHALGNDYAGFLIGTLKDRTDFTSLRLVVDCSHGANSELAPQIFKALGAELTVTGASPNGKNINVGCGSQHVKSLAQLVLKKKAHAGVAFDGDGDRLILVDEKGDTVDGDHILAILARAWKNQKRLKQNTVVITIMANLGLKLALKEMGVRSEEVAVGDRYVSEAMRKTGAVLGGEQSGHIILGDYLPTGDGLLTALHILSVLKQTGKPLSHLRAWMQKFPQILVNIPVVEKIPLEQLPDVQRVIKNVENKLGERGRVVARYSGTEPLLRIMIEGPNKKTLEVYGEQIKEVAQASSAC